MSVVLDASFSVDLIVSTGAAELESTARSMSQDVILVPAFFWHEVASGLRNMHLRGRLKLQARGIALNRLRTLRVTADPQPPPIEVVVGVSDRFQLTVYDAAYLELAIRTESALATRDRGLAAAAAKAGVALVASAEPR